eukprot:g31253.t1
MTVNSTPSQQLSGFTFTSPLLRPEAVSEAYPPGAAGAAAPTLVVALRASRAFAVLEGRRVGRGQQQPAAEAHWSCFPVCCHMEAFGATTHLQERQS